MISRLAFDFLAACILAATAALGAYTPLFLAERDRLAGGTGRSFPLIMGNMFSAGVMVSAGFVHLLGEAVRQMPEAMQFSMATFLCGLGYLLTLVADKAASFLSGASAYGDEPVEVRVGVDLAERVQTPGGRLLGAGGGGGMGSGPGIASGNSAMYSQMKERYMNSEYETDMQTVVGLTTGAAGSSLLPDALPPLRATSATAGGVPTATTTTGTGTAAVNNGTVKTVVLQRTASEADAALANRNLTHRLDPHNHHNHNHQYTTARGGGGGGGLVVLQGPEQVQQEHGVVVVDVDGNGPANDGTSSTTNRYISGGPLEVEGGAAHSNNLHRSGSSASGNSSTTTSTTNVNTSARPPPPLMRGVRIPPATTAAAMHHCAPTSISIAPSVSVSFLTAVLMAVALCFHSLLEGAAMGAQTTITNSLHIFIAIVSHKGLAAYALGSSIVESRVEARQFWSVVLPFTFASPVGIFLGYIISDAAAGMGAAAISALASGTFLYVAFMEVIPRELNSPKYIGMKLAALLLGFGLMSLLAVWA